MSKEEFIINGAKFSSKNGFYNYIEKHFTAGLSWKIGRNLNAFNDILSGGFGKHGQNEEIIVRWKNLSKSRSRLDTIFLNCIIQTLHEHPGVEFYEQEY